jgi:mono/diheme cytochrome c family protein
MSKAPNWKWIAGALVVSAACSGGNPPAADPAVADDAPAQAAPTAQAPAAAPGESAHEVFKSRCSPCHGNTGRGDGPASATLNPRPRDYSDAAWQKTVTDEQLKQVILYGGAAVGKSPVMPSQPDLESKPEVLAGLIKIIRDASTVQ